MAILKFTKELEQKRSERNAKMADNSQYQEAKLIWTDTAHMPRALPRNTMMYTIDSRELFIGNDIGIKRVNIGTDIAVIDKTDYLLNDIAERDYMKKEDLESGEFANGLKEYTDQKISDVINSAPDALDTLKEISDALGNDPNFATSILDVLANKVDKEEGKGLSEANFTQEEKNKLNGIEAGAQVNTVIGIRGSEDPVFYTGEIVLGCDNIGAATADHTHDGTLKLGSSYVRPLESSAILSSDTFNGAVGKLEASVVKLKTSVDAIPSDIVSGETFNSKVSEIENAANSLSRTVEALDGTVTSNKNAADLKFAEHYSSITDNTQNIGLIDDKVKNLEQTLQDNVSTISDHTGQIKENKDNLDAAILDIDDLKSRVGTNETTIGNHTSSISDIDSRLGALKTEVDTIGATTSGNASSITESIELINTNATALEKRVTANEKSIAQNVTNIASNVTEIGKTNTEVTALKKTVNDNKDELNGLIQGLKTSKANNTVTFEELLTPGQSKIQSGDSITVTIQKLQAQIDWLMQHSVCDS